MWVFMLSGLVQKKRNDCINYEKKIKEKENAQSYNQIRKNFYI